MIDCNRPEPQDQPIVFPRVQGIPEFKKNRGPEQFLSISNTDELPFIDKSFY